MTSNTLHCHICHVDLADNESAVKRHISSTHLNYRPFDCNTCKEEDNSFQAATQENMDAHIAITHGATSSAYHVTKEQIKESELKSAIDECRRVSSLQLAWDQNPASNRLAGIDEIVQATRDSKEHLPRVFISLGDTSTDSGNISTEMKQENSETFYNAASEDIRPEVEQNHNAPAMDQTLPEATQNLTDCPALTDCQATLLPVFDQPSDINEETSENQEVAPNIDFSHLTCINLYPSAILSDITDNKCEINTVDHFHETIDEVQYSNLTRTSTITDQVFDNGNTQSSGQNEIHTALDSSASGDITATATIAPFLTEISHLKRAKGSNKQIGSRASKPSIVSQETRQHEEMPLRMRGRKQIHSDIDSGHELAVKRKRSHFLRIEQNFSKSDSLPTFIGDGQNQLQHIFGKIMDENYTDDDENGYEFEQSADGNNSYDDESGTKNETVMNKTRTGSKIEEKRFKCDICSYSSKYMHVLLAHRRIHSGEKPFKCTQCSYTSAHAHILKKHMCTHTGEKAYKCSHCSYACAQLNNLERHMLTHTGEKPHKCSQCSFASTQAIHLKTHMLTHTGDKPYKCTKCSYASVTADQLIMHVRSHTGEKPFKCSQCSFASTQSGALKSHIRTHTGEKPFKCSQCSYASADAGSLKKHMRTHTGEKPYKCDHCSYTSAQSGNLNSHMRTHV